jgi:glucuronoarabinoxylan endo-1,4-beta-xylanase
MMGPLKFFVREFITVFIFKSAPVQSTHIDFPDSLETWRVTGRKFFTTPLIVAFFLFLVEPGSAMAQTATIDWTNVHQVIDGFGASDESQGASMSPANQAFFFGTGSGQLGLSLLRVGVTDGNQDPGDCTSVGISCAGVYVSDMQAAIANGGRVYASPWSPPAAYKTNRNTSCAAGSGNGTLALEDYGAYATWLANFVQSLKSEYGITLYAISVQNEPEGCHTYDSAVWSAESIDTFVKTNLGPTFAAEELPTLIFAPEAGTYSQSASLGAACGSDISCAQYIGGFNWHEYGASFSGTNTVAADPYPADWPSGKKYWETEASCGPGYGPNFCQPGFVTNITDALDWAAVVDERIAGDGANAWLYWWFVDENNIDDEGLIARDGTITQRAYMLGQYSKFVRPGYSRIDATHYPQTGVSVSAYQNADLNNLVIIATNYTNSAVSQRFNIANAPTFSTLTPTMTSSSLSLAAQLTVSVSGNSFTYTLPAYSITTFAGNVSIPPPPTNLSGMVLR